MPKSRRVVKNANAIHKYNVLRKFRVGTRKDGTSALRMTTDVLKAILEKADMRKYHQNVKTVLAMRGLTI